MPLSKPALFDGHSLAYRTLYGLPLYDRASKVHFTTASGEYTHAVYGFRDRLLKVRADGIACPSDWALAWATCLLTAISWPLQALIRHRGGTVGPVADRTATWSRRLAWGMCVIDLVLVAGLGLSNPSVILVGLSPLLRAALHLGWVSLALGLAVAILALPARRRRSWTRTGRAYFTLVARAGLAFAWFLYRWSLLGVQTGLAS